MPDRESKFLKNGTYYAKIICTTNGEVFFFFIYERHRVPADVLCTADLVFFLPCLSDSPTKTATGTIAIQVEDFNDHCPILTSTTKTMCHWDNFIYVTAHDEDDFPNSAPYDFTVIEDSGKGQWVVEPLNGELNESMNIKYPIVGCA